MKFIIFFSALILVACSGGRETIKKDEVLGPVKHDESFDPLTLNDNDIVIQPERGESMTDEGSANDQGTNASRAEEVNGFRVQILATNNLETASLVEQEATERFSRDGHETYLVFETPLYKIRIGDCENRQQAEEIRDLAQSLGYKGAFIVKSKIISKR